MQRIVGHEGAAMAQRVSRGILARVEEEATHGQFPEPGAEGQSLPIGESADEHLLKR